MGCGVCRVLRVPTEYPTIQAAIDAADSCDTVLVAADTYYEHEIMMKNGVVLRGETGDPSDVVIDAQQQGTVIRCVDLVDTTRIEGLTLTGGVAEPGGGAGGLYSFEANLVLDHCRFEGMNTGDAGGMVCALSWVVLRHCTFYENGGTTAGAFYSWTSSVRLTNCTFSDNAVRDTMGCLTFSSSIPAIVEQTIIAFTVGGQAIRCSDLVYNTSVICSNLYGNDGGDWHQPYGPPCIAGQGALPGNISADPMFCDRASGDLTLDCASPCLEYISSCGRIGAHGWACGTAGVDQVPMPSQLRLMTRPNPSNRIMRISYEQPKSSKGELRILTVTGRLVRRIELTAPSGQITWDGVNDLGEVEAPGLYFLRLEAGGQAVTKKVVLVR
jgi:hypothetical protein